MPEVKSDVIVIPVHNRREITCAALQQLAADGVFTWATVLIVDDGSTDHTATAVEASFPGAEILRGDGTWWWCGAIRRGMEWALARSAERIFWLNDDCRPPAGGLARMRDLVMQSGGVVWIDAVAPGGWSYGGHRKTPWRIRRCTRDEERAGQIDTFSGNCVCLPRAWIDRVGLPHDHLFPHGIGDLDYGLRLHAAGAVLQAVPGLLAENLDPAPAAAESWLASRRPLRAIWNDFRSPRSFLYFPAWRRFALRHWGLGWGSVVFSVPYLRWLAIACFKAVAPGVARRWSAHRTISSPSGRAGFPG